MDQHVMSRRQLLQALGLAGVAAPFAAAFGSSTAFAQGACRDGFGRGRCPLDMETATKAITPVFAPTGWRTVSLDHIAFQVADHKKRSGVLRRAHGLETAKSGRHAGRDGSR